MCTKNPPIFNIDRICLKIDRRNKKNHDGMSGTTARSRSGFVIEKKKKDSQAKDDAK